MFSILGNLFLLSVAFAIPSSQLGDPLSRRREMRQSQSVKRAIWPPPTNAGGNIFNSTNLSGAVWVQPDGAFNTVKGTFTVPTPSGEAGSAASIWVGLDGGACHDAALQTGIEALVDDNGGVSYRAWGEWFPDNPEYLDIAINTGDTVTAVVIVFSTTLGMVLIENETTDQLTWNEFQNPAQTLCEGSAEWIVEAIGMDKGSNVSLTHFDTVTFSRAVASGSSGGIYRPTDPGASLFNMSQNGLHLTAVTINKDPKEGETLTITYIGPK